MRPKPPILIVGGAGFIGSYISKALIKKGEKIISTYRNELDPEKIIKSVVYCKRFDLEPEIIESIETVVYTPRPDAVTLSETFTFLKKLPKLKKIVYLSTFGVYPDSLERQKETVRIDPVSEYQKKKYDEEISFVDFAAKQNIKFCIARVSNPYGDVYDKQLIGILIRQLFYQKDDFKLNGDGGQLKDFIFIEDAAELISLLVTRNQKAATEIFNVCSGEGHSVNEVIEILENLSGKKLICEKGHEFPTGEKINSVGDNTKIILASGYHMRYPLMDGLKKALDNYEVKIKNVR